MHGEITADSMLADYRKCILSVRAIRESLKAIANKTAHPDRVGKFSTREFSCVYVWHVQPEIVEWEAINNGVRVGLYKSSVREFIERMIRTEAQRHWTIGA